MFTGDINILMGIKSRSRQFFNGLRSILMNKYFWMGLGVLAAIGVLIYLVVNFILMPMYTRHDVAITVPSVINRPIEEAERVLRERNLRVEKVNQRFNPGIPRDVVVDQSPGPESEVKPNRRIFLTVNSGTVPMVTIPAVEGYSLREAVNRLRALGLEIGETLPDSVPAPFPNTVTRQEPAAGDSLAQGARVNLWYSTGLGERYVSIPDVTGLTLQEAQEILSEHRLRYVVLRPDQPDGETGDPSGTEADTEERLIVTMQRREPGTRVREGFEVRLFVADIEEADLEEEMLEGEEENMEPEP